jgi:hypothetical protein
MVPGLSKSHPGSIWSVFSKKWQELRGDDRDGFVLEEVELIEGLKTFNFHHRRNVLQIGAGSFRHITVSISEHGPGGDHRRIHLGRRRRERARHRITIQTN